jgi:hypothetical protein
MLAIDRIVKEFKADHVGFLASDNVNALVALSLCQPVGRSPVHLAVRPDKFKREMHIFVVLSHKRLLLF